MNYVLYYTVCALLLPILYATRFDSAWAWQRGIGYGGLRQHANVMFEFSHSAATARQVPNLLRIVLWVVPTVLCCSIDDFSISVGIFINLKYPISSEFNKYCIWKMKNENSTQHLNPKMKSLGTQSLRNRRLNLKKHSGACSIWNNSFDKILRTPITIFVSVSISIASFSMFDLNFHSLVLSHWME